MSKEIKNRIEYTVMCIGEFSERYSLSIHAAYSYLKKYGGIALMKDCYDAMHLQSIFYITELISILIISILINANLIRISAKAFTQQPFLTKPKLWL